MADVPLMPSEVSDRVGAFDRFANRAASVASRAWFFAFCVLLVLVWLPSYFVMRNLDTWQLIINTCTTIITFLLVALLQNSQTRTDNALQHKLNAIAQGLSDLMEHVAALSPEEAGELGADLTRDRQELQAAIGLEDHEGSSHNLAEDSSHDLAEDSRAG
jgi:low affinity Fe/Cu permease